MFDWIYKLLQKVCIVMFIQKEETKSVNYSFIGSSLSMPLLVSTRSTPPIDLKELRVTILPLSSFSKSKAIYETWQVYDRVPASPQSD